MTEPKQPDDHPAPEANPVPPPDTTNGTPPKLVEAEPTGDPTSDRHATEIAATPD